MAQPVVPSQSGPIMVPAYSHTKLWKIWGITDPQVSQSFNWLIYFLAFLDSQDQSYLRFETFWHPILTVEASRLFTARSVSLLRTYIALLSISSYNFFFYFFFKFYFIFKFYIIVLVLPNIKMNPSYNLRFTLGHNWGHKTVPLGRWSRDGDTIWL